MMVFSRKFYEVLDNLIADFDIRFNTECVTIVDVSKCLHPYDNFELFDVKDVRRLYEHYEGDFVVHTDVNLVIAEYMHYINKLHRDFDTTAIKEITFTKVNCWLHKINMFPLIFKLVKLVSVIQFSTTTCEMK